MTGEMDIVPVPVPEKPGQLTVGVLRYLGYDIAKPETQSLVLICHRYKLDPLAGHVQIIKTKQGPAVYITASGYREVAEASGQLLGITETETHEGETGFRVRVRVTRQLGRGTGIAEYEFAGGCGRLEPQGLAGKGMEMARTRAVRTTLRWAFPIRARYVLDGELDEYADVDDAALVDTIEANALPSAQEPPRPPPVAAPPPSQTRGRSSPSSDQAAAHRVIGELAFAEQARWLARWSIEDFGSVWPADAVADALEQPFRVEPTGESPAGFDPEQPALDIDGSS